MGSEGYDSIFVLYAGREAQALLLAVTLLCCDAGASGSAFRRGSIGTREMALKTSVDEPWENPYPELGNVRLFRGNERQ